MEEHIFPVITAPMSQPLSVRSYHPSLVSTLFFFQENASGVTNIKPGGQNWCEGGKAGDYLGKESRHTQ